MDNMLRMMEKYANNLEEVIGERTRQLVEEKKKGDMLLYRMLPALVTSSVHIFNIMRNKSSIKRCLYHPAVLRVNSSPIDTENRLFDRRFNQFY
jgi:hypothetical protein